MTLRIVRADAILPGEERPILDGAIVLDESGTVLDVGGPPRFCRVTPDSRSKRSTACSCPAW